MVRLRWLLIPMSLVAIVSASNASSASRSTTPTRFAITRVDIPLFVKQNGPRGTRRIYWTGAPTFPVTVHERGICPEGVNCGALAATGWGSSDSQAVYPNHRNPLVSPNYYYCNGSLTSNYVIGVENWLTDAKGRRTAIVRSFWVCKTH